MRLKFIAIPAALAMVSATPVLAAPANPAAPLSLMGGSVRTGSSTTRASHLQGGELIAAIAAVAIGAGAVILAATAHKDHPASP